MGLREKMGFRPKKEEGESEEGETNDELDARPPERQEDEYHDQLVAAKRRAQRTLMESTGSPYSAMQAFQEDLRKIPALAKNLDSVPYQAMFGEACGDFKAAQDYINGF